jgi:selenocysteine lyase/cysteine desulfurase
MVEYGINIRKNFLLDYKYTFINNASRGVIAIEVLNDSNRIRKFIESVPYLNVDAFNRYSNASNFLANIINAPVSSTVLTKNTTYGLNSVISSIKFDHNDSILITNLTYNATKNMVNNVSEKYKTKILIQEIRFPINYNSILRDYEEIINRNKNIKLIIIEHITSPTAILMQIKELINIARRNNIKILVDGAHAIGTLDLNMDLLKPDWYVGSLHKWCFTMKSVGFLYTDIINQDITKSLIVSHLYKKSYMQRFFMQGTEDQSGYLSVPVAFNFINQMGGIKSISNYNSNLVRTATKICCNKWNTITLIPIELCGPTMVPIILPFNYKKILNKFKKDVLKKLNKLILDRYKIETIIFLAKYNGEPRICTRLSCSIYNIHADYIRYSDVILELKEMFG